MSLSHQNHKAWEVYQVHNEFINKKGSEHIATLSSLMNLSELLTDYEPKSVLDFGSGIGTITQLVLRTTKATVVCYEKNSWCIDQLKLNILEKNRIEITDVIPSQKFDVIIIDDDISRKQIRKIIGNCRPKTVFIEGYRNRTVGQISKRLMFYGLSASYERGNSREDEFSGILTSEKIKRIKNEKAGAWFLLDKRDLFSNLFSWLSRLGKTREIMEVIKQSYFAISRTLSIRSRFRKYFRHDFKKRN